MTKRLSRPFILASAAATVLAGCQDQAASGGAGGSRSELRIVGSSTVFPFAKAVAERFAAEGGNKAPVLESTGTGGGIEQFCSGVGSDTPDIVNASRRMKASEFETCVRNGVTEIVEIAVGIDGIAMAHAKGARSFDVTAEQVYKALAATPFGRPQMAKLWSDIDPALPAMKISVFGPPTTSGTRDAFDELIMEAGCQTDAATKALKDSDKDAYEKVCHEIRSDGSYMDQGENDNLIVGKLVANPASLGVFGYSYMEENADKVEGMAIGGVKPTYDSIAAGDYPGARRLYIYVKKAHVGKIPGLAEFAAAFVEAGAGDGYLRDLGLITLPEADRGSAVAAAKNMPLLDKSVLK